MELVPYNNESILTDVPPTLKKNFEELFCNAESGFSTLTLNDVSAVSHYTEGDFKYSYSYIVRVPYAGNRLVWEVSFDPEDLEMAPDFYFNDDNFTISNDIDKVVENIPSLLNWDVKNPKSLTVVLNEFLNLYNKQQILKLEQDNIYAQLNSEYQVLIAETSPQDIEISIDLEDSCAHFLINITVDTSSLPEYLQTQEKILNPGADTCVLKISFLKLDASRVKTSLQLSPRLDQIFGSSKTLGIPYTKANSLVEYVKLVMTLLENHVKKVGQRYKLRKEFITSLCAIYPEKIIEFDAETFSKMVLFAEVDDFECTVEIKLGKLFPDEQPIVTLSSLYCVPLKKVCSEQVSDYSYSPQWSPENMLTKLMAAVNAATKRFKNHEH